MFKRGDAVGKCCLMPMRLRRPNIRHAQRIPTGFRCFSLTSTVRSGHAIKRGLKSRNGRVASLSLSPGWATTSPGLSRRVVTTAASINETSDRSAARYTPPTRGLVASLPKGWIPYAELMRLDKPTGTYYLFFPCLFSTLLAAPFAGPAATPLVVASYSGLFFLGALIMRGAGCSINDLWDRNLDPHVERTQFRPIARKAITPPSAIVFTGAQLLAGLAVLLQFPADCFWYATPSLLLVATYPLAKRVTHYPQAVLGLTFSWGAIMGFPTLGVDLLADSNAAMAAAALYSSCIAWTILYDTIYAHMDVKYDAAAGIKSIALKHQGDTKTILSGLAAVQIGLLAAAGIAAGSGPVFFIGSCGSAIMTLGAMIWRVKLDDPKDCWWWFQYGCWFTGGGIATGLLGEYLSQRFGIYKTSDDDTSNGAQNDTQSD